jgi:4-aminobutyrate aminotransferase-like enzyme
MLHRGFILLPEGEHGSVISVTPPLTITEAQLERMVQAMRSVLECGDWSPLSSPATRRISKSRA